MAMIGLLEVAVQLACSTMGWGSGTGAIRTITQFQQIDALQL